MGLARGYTDIVFPSQVNAGGTNVVVYIDRLADNEYVVVNDPDNRLPKDQASWRR